MRKILLLLFFANAIVLAFAQTSPIPRDPKIEAQIDAMLKKMTLEEKIGQMTQLTIDVLAKSSNPFAGINPDNFKVSDLKRILKTYKLDKDYDLSKGMPNKDVLGQIYLKIQSIQTSRGFQLNEVMLDSVIGKYKVGSILNVPNGVAQSVGKWQEIIKRIQEKSMLTEYTIDVFRELDQAVEDEDIYLDEFRDEIDGWVIDAIKGIGIDTAKAVLNASREMLIEKADLEEGTVDEVLRILRAEFEEEGSNEQ